MSSKKVMVIGGLAESLINFRGPLLREMVTRGHHVTACAPGASTMVKNALGEMGVSYKDIMIDRVSINPASDIKALYAYVSAFKKIKPDVVLSYTIKPVIYGSIAARMAKVPHIYSMITGLGYVFIGDSLNRRMISLVARLLYSISLRLNKRVFFLNPDDISLFLELGILKKEEDTVLINGTGVDIDKFSQKPFPDGVSFLLIARLLKDKGIYEYIEAAHIIKEKYSSVNFRLVGWLDENPACIEKYELEAWIESGVIEYLGKLEDVRPALADASIYVLPSYREGIPQTVLEAMAMGRPIITTDAPGCRETVMDGKNGFLVSTKNVKSLVDAMEKFINEPTLIKKMGMKSRQIVEGKYDVHKVNAVIMKTMGL